MACYRTARGHEAGVALSLVATSADRAVLAEAQDLLRLDENSEDLIKPYAFKVEAIDGLRYRVRVRSRIAVVRANKENLLFGWGRGDLQFITHNLNHVVYTPVALHRHTSPHAFAPLGFHLSTSVAH